MELEFDPRKRQWTLATRGIDFEDAAHVFAGSHVTDEDTRQDYGEVRHLTFGTLHGRVVVIGWTLRERNGVLVRRVFSMRKANEKEIARFQERLR
jgi:uncharacterized DUF497 family protein